MTPPTPADGRETGSVRLSTGERVGLPLRTDAAMAGAAFPADRERAADILPAGLAPVPVGCDRAPVAFLCVDYRRIRASDVEPYEEFGVVVPAIPERSAGAPGSAFDRPVVSTVRSLLAGGVGGYVWYLPVSTEPARALGAEIWGYPKALADVAVERDGRDWRTTVTVEGDRFATLEVRAPPGVRWSQSAHGYAVDHGTLFKQPLEVSGKVGAWPLGRRASCELGDHPRADRLRRLDLGSRPLGRFAADGEFVVHPGEAVTVGRSGHG